MSGKRRRLDCEASAFPLHSAVKVGSLRDVLNILEEGNVAVDAVDSKGYTPFALACRRRKRQDKMGILRALLKARCDPHQAFKWFQGRRTTAAVAAVESRNAEMMETLLEFGVSPADEFEGRALIVTAAQTAVNAHARGAMAVLKLLLQNVASRDVCVTASLHLACRAGDTRLARVFLEAGASAEAEENGRTPLYVVSRLSRGSLELAELLLKFGADVNRMRGGESEWTPLLGAVSSGFKDKPSLIRLLVSRGANLHFRTRLGTTPLVVAASSGCPKVTEVLLQLGADPNVAQGATSPLHAASELGHHQVARMLLDAGAVVDAPGRFNETPFVKAIARWHTNEDRVATLNLLVERGADVNWRFGQGRTPLHYACGRLMQEIIGFLLENGADCDARDDDEETPLNVVCTRHAYPDRSVARATRTLLAFDADVEATSDLDPSRPPFLQAEAGHMPRTMQRLFEYKMEVMPIYDEDEDDE